VTNSITFEYLLGWMVNEFHAFFCGTSFIRLFLSLVLLLIRPDSVARHPVALLTDLHATQEWVISTLHFARDFVSWCYIQRINNAGHASQVYTPTTPKSLFMRELLHAEREMLFCMPPHTYERKWCHGIDNNKICPWVKYRNKWHTKMSMF